MTTQVTGDGVKFNGSTSGTITLTQPAIAGTNTLTLPAETGTLRSTVSSGTVLQVVNYQTGAVATGTTTTTPVDDTIPQNTEGNEYMSLTITPRSATSTLIINVAMIGAHSNSNSTMVLALFQDSTANALATLYTGARWLTATLMSPIALNHKMTSGTTSATTFKVRLGSNQAKTTTVNGSSSTRYGGGVMSSNITITEVVP